MCGCEGREHRTPSCYLCRALEVDDSAFLAGVSRGASTYEPRPPARVRKISTMDGDDT